MSAPQINSSLITADAYWAMQPLPRTELQEGGVIQLGPTSLRHGAVEMRLARFIDEWTDTHGGLVLVGEVGYRLNATTVRAPDIALHLTAPTKRGWFEEIPELVVEVVSPNDTWSAVERKASLWLAAGVQEVWVADPDERCVLTRGAAGLVLFKDEPLTSVLLPDLAIDLGRVFR